MFEALFAPRWAGGWAITMRLFALGQVLEMVRQGRQILDSYRHPTFNFGVGIWHLSESPLYGEAAAFTLWGAGCLGLAGLAWGGRVARPGLAAWMLAEVSLFVGLGWELNAPERIMAWVAIGLMLGPIGERGLFEKWRSPVGRWFLMIWAAGMYGMAGWMKTMEESGWWDGSILSDALADPIMGGTPWSIWAAGVPWIPKVLSWFTMIFEVSFGMLAVFPETNPWILLVGLLFHGGVSSLMWVGTLGFTVVSTYPVLLDPDRAEGLWREVEAARSRR